MTSLFKNESSSKLRITREIEREKFLGLVQGNMGASKGFAPLARKFNSHGQGKQKTPRAPKDEGLLGF